MRPLIGFFCVCLLGLSQTDDPAEKSHRAKQAMVAGNFEQAATLYRELVRALPDNPDLHMNLGLALHSAGHYSQAIAEFTTVLKARPDYTEAWLLIGLERQKLGQPEAAIAPLERVLRAEPSNKIALLELGDACLNTGRAEEAASHFARLTELDPGSAKGWQGLGLSYHSLARHAFEKLEQVAPGSSYYYALLARAKFEQQQYGSAFRLFKLALDAQPQGLRGLHAGLAEIYRATAHPDWAATEDAREADLPRRSISGSAEDLYQQEQQFSRKALEAFSRLEQLPPSVEIHELMAEAYRIQGGYVQAIEQYHLALKSDPANRGIEKQLAKTLWLARDLDSAQPLLQHLLAADPHSAELNYELGDVLLERKQPQQAAPYLEAAVKFDPGLVAAHASLARAYLQTDRTRQAIVHLKIALPADQDGSLHYQLARAYEKTGQTELARRQLAEYRASVQSRQDLREEIGRDAQITPP